MNATMNFDHARHLMIEQQIRPWDVLDPDVLDLLGIIKREDFVPAAYRNLAFVDFEIPLGHGQAMMSPKMEARILQTLALTGRERVVEIGTGSGYMAALLAHRADYVTSVELHADFSASAQQKLAKARITNVELKVADAARSLDGVLATGDKVDVIVLTGSTPVLPPAFLERLGVGGKLFAVTGKAPVMEAMLYTRESETAVTERKIFETVLPPLVNAAAPSRFRF